MRSLTRWPKISDCKAALVGLFIICVICVGCCASHKGLDSRPQPVQIAIVRIGSHSTFREPLDVTVQISNLHAENVKLPATAWHFYKNALARISRTDTNDFLERWFLGEETLMPPFEASEKSNNHAVVNLRRGETATVHFTQPKFPWLAFIEQDDAVAPLAGTWYLQFGIKLVVDGEKQFVLSPRKTIIFDYD